MDSDDSVAADRREIAGKDGFLTNSTPSRAGSAGSTRKAAVLKKATVAKPRKTPAKRSAKPATSKATTSRTTAPETTARKPAVAALKAVTPPSAMLELVLAKLDDMKAEQTVVIDMRGRSLFADDMVVTSGRSNRHVASIAESVARGLKEAGHKKVHVEGLTNADWVLIDTGEVTVHVFRPEVREFYNLERLWTHGPEALAKPA